MEKVVKKLLFDGKFDETYVGGFDYPDAKARVSPDNFRLIIDLEGSSRFSNFEDIRTELIADFDFTADVKIFTTHETASAGLFFRKPQKGTFYLFLLSEDYGGCYAFYDGVKLLSPGNMQK